MTTGKFLKQLHVLNPALRVCSFEGSNKLAGLHYIDKQGEYFDICGVDKNYVQEYSEFDSQGHMLHSGWRRVFQILLELKLTTAAQIKKVCPGFFLHWSQMRVDADRKRQMIGNAIEDKRLKYSLAHEDGVLTTDEVLDVAADIRAKDSDAQKEQDEKNRWFLKTWADRGGNISDKPKI